MGAPSFAHVAKSTPSARSFAVSLLAPVAKVDAVVIAAGFDPSSESEGADRTFSLPFGQEELIRELSAVNQNTIVTVTSGGSVDPNDWLDRVQAYLELWYPGERGGTALAEILFGAVNPSGHLPVTFERRWTDNPVHDSYYPESGTNQVVYKEDVFVGYRGYEHDHVKPLCPFGYGLSYTTFQYSHLEVKPDGDSSTGARYNVTFDVTNTGHRAGADVTLVYVAEADPKVPRPPKELKGFSRVDLAPGETKHVSQPARLYFLRRHSKALARGCGQVHRRSWSLLRRSSSARRHHTVPRLRC
jgi:beta-glucosidase